MTFVISEAELKRRALTDDVAATGFLRRKQSHGDLYAGTGSSVMRSDKLPKDIKVPLRSDLEFKTLPPISEIKNG